ncbi:MAG: bifunctional heptose 7-phosphate kinase/heptose 1-phosphate adenyltransferase [Candidatus Hermodarchaeota archaeon]
MSLADNIKDWKQKKILIVGEALVDKYIIGFADRISPDAPVPNIKIEDSSSYIGGIGLVLQYIKSLGGIPEVCTVIGNDFEGDFFLKAIKKLNIESSGILMDDSINTPQITRLKAMNQHLLRLETDYNSDISGTITENFLKIIGTRSKEIDSILILDYGTGGLFSDLFIQNLLAKLRKTYENIPIIVRPNTSNYYLYENVDLIKINLQKALQTFSIDCCNETSVSIVGKKILNLSKCKYVLLNYLEIESYLFSRDQEKVEKILPILKHPVRSFVAVGSAIMAALGLSFASGAPVVDAVKLALYAAALTASLPPVEFYDLDKLKNYILTFLEDK